MVEEIMTKKKVYTWADIWFLYLVMAEIIVFYQDINNFQDPYKKLSIMAGFNEWWWKQYSHLFKELLVETLLPLL